MQIKNLVETHCHILPGIDDGAHDVTISTEMVDTLINQGAKSIILTPHYYSDSISLDDFLARRNEAFETLKSAVAHTNIKLIPAAEVFISDYLFSNDNLDELKIGNSEYILIEHPFSSSFGKKEIDRLLALKFDYAATPILAHIERYKTLMNSEKKLDELIDAGCAVQVNINSFFDSPRGVKKKLFKYLESGRIHLVGSDCHNMDKRPPVWEKGVNAIIEKCGNEALDALIKNANIIADM